MMESQKIKNSKKYVIAYTYLKYENQPCIVYLHGLRSSRNSEKGKRIRQFCLQNNYSFLSVDYTGHGESEGKPDDFRIHQCLEDVVNVVRFHNIREPLYLVGSSLGGWISFLLAEQFPQQVKGILTCAAGVDFLPMVWHHMFNDKIRDLLKNGAVIGPNEETHGHCFSYPMFVEAEPFLLLNRKIQYNGSVILAHGDKDEIIPFENSFKIKDALESQDVCVHIVKGDNHSLQTYPLENNIQSLIERNAA